MKLTSAVLLSLLVTSSGWALQSQDPDKDKDKHPKQEEPKRPETPPQETPSKERDKQQDRDRPQDRDKPRDRQDKENPQDQKQQDRPRANPQERERQQPNPDRQQQDRERRSEDRNKVQQDRNRSSSHESARHGGRRIPDDRFRAQFGREHTFHVRPNGGGGGVQGAAGPRFQYAGYWFECVEPWPAEWVYDDDYYIDYLDDDYYLYDTMHPGYRILVIVVE